MALTRNERRKVAKARLVAKTERLVKAHNAAVLVRVRAIVASNLAAPKERNFYPQSSMSNMEGNSHRGYVCQASGAMPRQQALALKAKGSW